LPKWDKTDTIAGLKWWLPDYADVGFDVDIGPLFKLLPKPTRQLKMMFIFWVFHHWQQATNTGPKQLKN
jgi:hypothetical protein